MASKHELMTIRKTQVFRESGAVVDKCDINFPVGAFLVSTICEK